MKLDQIVVPTRTACFDCPNVSLDKLALDDLSGGHVDARVPDSLGRAVLLSISGQEVAKYRN